MDGRMHADHTVWSLAAVLLRVALVLELKEARADAGACSARAHYDRCSCS